MAYVPKSIISAELGVSGMIGRYAVLLVTAVLELTLPRPSSQALGRKARATFRHCQGVAQHAMHGISMILERLHNYITFVS